MALNRKDSIVYRANAGTFTSATVTYAVDYLGKINTLTITVNAADLPGNVTPSGAQISAVSDPKALAMYASWKQLVDQAVGATSVFVTGNAGVLSAD